MKKPISLSLLLGFSLSTLPVLAHTITAPCIIIDAPGSAWEYTINDPTADSSWTTTTGGGWSVGNAPFSDLTTGDFAQNTLWSPDTPGDMDDDLWLRKAIDLAAFDLGTIHYDIGIDNGFTLYVNGVQVDSQNKEGIANRWDYSSAIPEALLLPGINYFALALEDHGGNTSFDFQLGSDVCVPETGSSLALLGAGLGSLMMVRRRFSL